MLQHEAVPRAQGNRPCCPVAEGFVSPVPQADPTSQEHLADASLQSPAVLAGGCAAASLRLQRVLRNGISG